MSLRSRHQRQDRQGQPRRDAGRRRPLRLGRHPARLLLRPMRDLPRDRGERPGRRSRHRREGHRARLPGQGHRQRRDRVRSCRRRSPSAPALVTGISPLASDIVEVVGARSTRPIDDAAGTVSQREVRRLPGARSQPDGALRRHRGAGRTRLPHPPLSGRARCRPRSARRSARPSRAGARAVRRRLSARGRRPARPDRRRHRLGADLVGRGRRAARAAPSRPDGDRGQPRRRGALHAPLARVADRRRRARGDRNRRDRRHRSGAARAADALPALARAGGHRLRRRARRRWSMPSS